MKTKFVGVLMEPKAAAVLKAEADRAKRTVSDYIRIILEERHPAMVSEVKKVKVRA